MITIEQVIEQCAKVCDELPMYGPDDETADWYGFALADCAKAIRALAKQYEGCIVFGAEPVVSAGLARTLERELAAMTERGQKAEAERDALKGTIRQQDAEREFFSSKCDALRAALQGIVEFVDAPVEGKRPDVFALRINKARAVLKEVKNV